MGRVWNRKRQTVVVDFSRGSIKMAAAESAGEAVRFRGITRIRLPRDKPDQSELEASEIVASIRPEVKRHGWQGMPVACLLSRSATSTQSFLFPPMPDVELRQAIALKLSETLHFDLNEASFDYRRIREYFSDGNNQVLTLVAAARKAAIHRALDILRQAGLRPVAVGAASESLANLTYYASLCGEDDATVHVDIGSYSTILNLFEGRLLRFSREIDTAGEAFTRALMRPIITGDGAVQLTHEQAEEVKASAGYPREDDETELPHNVKSSEILPLMEPVAQRLTAEIRRSIDYLRDILGRPSIDRIVLSGPAAQMARLDVMLEENLDTPVVFIDPVARAVAHWRLAICDESPPSPSGFSAILGYSLGHHQPINLLPREEKLTQMVQHVSRVRKVVAPSALSLALMLALAAIPIDRDYATAQELMQSVSNQLDQRLLSEMDLADRLEIANQIAQRVAIARGPVPNWVGIMKELSRTLPREVRISSFSTELEEGTLVTQLVAHVQEGPVPFEVAITELTVALGASPFFRNLHVVKAARSTDGRGGRFEATLEIVARDAESGTTKP